jgi:hypothetical protein
MPGSEQPTSKTPTPSQAISDAFWAAAELGSGPIVLDRAECMQLLATQSVGRVAYATDAGARILPVNYVLGADCVIFRTVPDGEIFRYALNSTVPSRSTRPMSSSSRVGAWWPLGGCSWRPRRTSLRCGMGGCLSLGQPVADGCSYDCRASMCPDGG